MFPPGYAGYVTTLEDGWVWSGPQGWSVTRLESHERSQASQLSKGGKFESFDQWTNLVHQQYPPIHFLNDSLGSNICVTVSFTQKPMRSINTNAMRVALRLMDQTHMLLGNLRVGGSDWCIKPRLRCFSNAMPTDIIETC